MKKFKADYLYPLAASALLSYYLFHDYGLPLHIAIFSTSPCLIWLVSIFEEDRLKKKIKELEEKTLITKDNV